MKKNIKDFTLEELQQCFLEMGEKKFRALQCFAWLQQGVESFHEMTNLSKELRQKLVDTFFVSVPKVKKKQIARDGTIKYLFENHDGTLIETVIMEYKHGISACISTQVGCNMGCRFCASTIGGKERDLTAGEILDQLIFASKDMGRRISNVVLMGIGEPLDNYENVIRFLKNVNQKSGLNIGYRHISLSTCGLVDKIEKLAGEQMPITLSISLHSTNNADRSSIMPVNRKYPIEVLLRTCREYTARTKRRISFEYTLIRGVNDDKPHARELAGLLRGMLCHVNLIPVNAVKETGLKRPTREAVEMFQQELLKNGINATVRRELGTDIDAACGQLRKNNQ